MEDAVEPNDINVGYDTLRVLRNVGAPTIDLGFGNEFDTPESSLLAPSLPPLRN